MWLDIVSCVWTLDLQLVVLLGRGWGLPQSSGSPEVGRLCDFRDWSHFLSTRSTPQLQDTIQRAASCLLPAMFSRHDGFYLLNSMSKQTLPSSSCFLPELFSLQRANDQHTGFLLIGLWGLRGAGGILELGHPLKSPYKSWIRWCSPLHINLESRHWQWAGECQLPNMCPLGLLVIYNGWYKSYKSSYY